jgi:predicted hydrocarbon binding protein
MPPTVNPRIPLSLLEAVRRIDTPRTDTPEEDPDTEYVQELRNKRLGLSDTVYQQIRRYSDAVKRGQLIPHAEATGLGKLIGRRPDAKAVFISAGEILANDVYQAISTGRRRLISHAPAMVGRRLALGNIRQIVRRFFGGSLTSTGEFVSLTVTDSVTANSGAPDAAGCEYYASALRELLRLMIDRGGAVDHVKCLEKGASTCEWHAEWRGERSKAA